ncbi:ABC transporter substrate-binding protein [Gracilibacillus sp. Marseille-QA3620]
MKKLWKAGFVAALALSLAACGEDETANSKAKQADTEAKEKTVTYMDKEYKVPADPTIVAASLESMEDLALLDVKPAGALAVGGELPSYLAEDLKGAELIGDKMQPNYETILGLDPDIILGTSKFQEDVKSQLEKIAPMMPISHVSTDWEANLTAVAELTGKEEEAEKILEEYKTDAAEVKKSVSESMKDKDVVIIRLRAGNLMIYGQDLYLNPVLYTDLGLEVPEEVAAAKAQEAISLEKLAEMNPDYIFLQFEESENADKPEALDELQKNAIWNGLNAVKADHVFINSVEPLAQGGTAWSKTQFLDAVQQNLTK